MSVCLPAAVDVAAVAAPTRELLGYDSVAVSGLDVGNGGLSPAGILKGFSCCCKVDVSFADACIAMILLISCAILK